MSTRDKFIHSTTLLAYTCWISNKITECNFILELTFKEILNIKIPPVIQRVEDIPQSVEKKDVQLWPYFQAIIFSDLNIQTFDVIFKSWTATVAPEMWYWIHIVTLFLNECTGNDERKYFIYVLTNLIGCSSCRGHYSDNIETLVLLTNQYSLSDVYLILHSAISTSTDLKTIATMTPTDQAHFYQNSFRAQYKNEYKQIVQE